MSQALPDAVRIVGHLWSAQTHRVKNFLARNLVPYQWLDVELDSEARSLVEACGPTSLLPLVLFPDGSQLSQPTNVELAEKIGLRMTAQQTLYDLIIVGAGPAGLGAAVYSASEGLRTLVLEREAPGGQAGASASIKNYLGFPEGVSGEELTRRARDQALRFGAEILTPAEVVSVQVQDQYRVVTLLDGSTVNGRALLIATGVSYRRLDVPGMDTFTGAGIYYGAAVTEAITCGGQEVYIVGGANSAGQAAVYLSEHAHKVTMLVRGASLAATMSQYLIDEINNIPNIEVCCHASVVEVSGNTDLDAITIEDNRTGERRTAVSNVLFIFIGALPRTEWVADVVICDAGGFILSGPDIRRAGQRTNAWPLARDPFWLETSVPGIFVAGDVRHRSVKRVASAVGEGAMAVTFIHQYLAEAHQNAESIHHDGGLH